MNRVIFGGSFDPVHNGHVNIVRQTAAELEADEVIVIPTGISPFKKDMKRVPASGSDRLAMCRLAFEDMPFVTVSDYEISRGSVSYTVDTVKFFRRLYPDDTLFLLIGSDMLLSFDRWRNYKEILADCVLCAASRANGQKDIDALDKKAAELSPYGKVILVKTEPFEISSTEIREKIMKNQDIACYMPRNVVKYIMEKNIYSERGNGED